MSTLAQDIHFLRCNNVKTDLRLNECVTELWAAGAEDSSLVTALRALSLSTWLHQSRVSGQPPGFLALRVVPAASLRVNIVNRSYLYERAVGWGRQSLATWRVTSSLWLLPYGWASLSTLYPHSDLDSPLSKPSHASSSVPVSSCDPLLLQLATVLHTWSLISCQLQQLTSTQWHLTVQWCTVLYCALQHTILQVLPGASISMPWCLCKPIPSR